MWKGSAVLTCKVLIVLVISAVVLTGVIRPVRADWREVTGRVKESIKDIQPPIGSHNIDIRYHGRGTITLEGYVESEDACKRVQNIAERTKGVSRVDNKLRVASTASTKDSSEAQRIREAFKREIPDAMYDVAILSKSGSVVLKGTADSNATREQLVSIAGAVSKRKIEDRLAIQMARSDMDVQETIRRTLSQEYPALTDNVEVSVQSGVASLHGNMSSRRDVDKVLATVLMIEGVKDIDSAVTVKGGQYAAPHEAKQ